LRAEERRLRGEGILLTKSEELDLLNKAMTAATRPEDDEKEEDDVRRSLDEDFTEERPVAKRQHKAIAALSGADGSRYAEFEAGSGPSFFRKAKR
jgi:hypothetical protein